MCKMEITMLSLLLLGPLPAKGYYVCHARNVQFSDIRVMTDSPDARPEIACEDDGS